MPLGKGSSFWALARLGYPEDRQRHLREDIRPSPLHGAVLDPDDHLLCFDYLYYVGGHQVRWFAVIVPRLRLVNGLV